jgi:hypothetical protein
MASLNDEIVDAVIARSVNLSRLSAGETRKILALLRRLELDLVDQLERVNPTGATRTAFQQDRLERLLKIVRQVSREHYAGMQQALTTDLKDVAELEGQFALNAINTPVGFELASVALSTPQLRALASETLINGSSLKTWWGRQSVDLQRRFTDTIRSGMMQGDSLQQLLNRVRGTRALGYTDGIMQTSRRSAETLIRTATAAVSQAAADATWAENDDVVKAVKWVATLDLRTTVLCMARDGHLYSVPDHKPLDGGPPWRAGPGRLHPN